MVLSLVTAKSGGPSYHAPLHVSEIVVSIGGGTSPKTSLNVNPATIVNRRNKKRIFNI